MMHELIQGARKYRNHRVLRAFAHEMMKYGIPIVGASQALDVADRLLESVLDEKLGVSELIRFRNMLKETSPVDLPTDSKAWRQHRLAYVATHPSAYTAAVAVNDYLFEELDESHQYRNGEYWNSVEAMCSEMRTFFVTASLLWANGPLTPQLPILIPVIESRVEAILATTTYDGWKLKTIERLSSLESYNIIAEVDEELCWVAHISREIISEEDDPQNIETTESTLLVFSGIDASFLGHAQFADESSNQNDGGRDDSQN